MKLLPEPLLHFVLIGSAIYLLYGAFAESLPEADDKSIVVSAGEIEWMPASWQKRWNRPPTPEEFDGLLQQFIRETVLYREALTMGLNQHDQVIRRLAQKLEFLAKDLVALTPPTDAELKAYFEENQDRYHATAVDTGAYLWRCMAYIDLNTVRARVVGHPSQWRHGGYREIQSPRVHYRVIDLERLVWLTGCSSLGEFQTTHRAVLETCLASGDGARDAKWTESIAVGREGFVETIRTRLGLSRLQRSTGGDADGYVLPEERSRYIAAVRREICV